MYIKLKPFDDSVKTNDKVYESISFSDYDG